MSKSKNKSGGKSVMRALELGLEMGKRTAAPPPPVAPVAPAAPPPPPAPPPPKRTYRDAIKDLESVGHMYLAQDARLQAARAGGLDAPLPEPTK